ncbi:hypothetical protein MetexDRAFT_0656 [Methylorubrum extorquens DSM 13060]|uniref:Uncharacterized protein n=2 Tax=Methylorubrum extorquens TaxID=408 RepID=C5B5R3_METEA|nr:Hypothetical protein MexAM1_META2p1002 [Methylorubrum extorquens AM1]EHP94457.1 hypothetical protein MetexDRAFT_0656 [Methylorubrum extorquens DSM 13060]MCP1546364.1 hypothetical protein [Methylorubrum extorquens]MCP1591031.1 hypothetical protein [Methylorubrum extorquens]
MGLPAQETEGDGADLWVGDHASLGAIANPAAESFTSWTAPVRLFKSKAMGGVTSFIHGKWFSAL